MKLLSITVLKTIGIPESGKSLLEESRILSFGIRNSAQGIQNPANDWNQKSEVH